MSIKETLLYQLTENAVVVGTEHNLHASSAGIAIAATGRERNWKEFN